jgi:choline dehydrogenase-like flavoprotein
LTVWGCFKALRSAGRQPYSV